MVEVLPWVVLVIGRRLSPKPVVEPPPRSPSSLRGSRRTTSQGADLGRAGVLVASLVPALGELADAPEVAAIGSRMILVAGVALALAGPQGDPSPYRRLQRADRRPF